MNVHEALLNRRTVYKYEAREVPEDVVERALEAARWAPNHKLTEPWGFIRVGPETRERLSEVAARLAKKKAEGLGGEEREAAIQRQRDKVRNLPLLIAVTSRKSPDDAFREREDYAATTCAIHNLVLSLWADGVGAQWGTGGVTRDAESYDILGVDGARDDIVGFIKAGYPEKVPTSRRKPLADVVRTLP